MFTPTGTGIETAARVIFHELAHDVSYSVVGSSWVVFKTNLDSSGHPVADTSGSYLISVPEQLAVIAEDIAYIKTFGGDVRVGHDAPSLHPLGTTLHTNDPALAFAGATNPVFKGSNISYGTNKVAEVSAKLGSDGTINKIYGVGNGYDPIKFTVPTIGGVASYSIVNFVALEGLSTNTFGIVAADGTLTQVGTNVFSGSANDKLDTTSVSAVANTVKYLHDIASSRDLTTVGVGLHVTGLKDLLAGPSFENIKSIVGLSSETTWADIPVVGQKRTGATNVDHITDAFRLYAQALDTGSWVIGASGTKDTSHNLDYSDWTDLLKGSTKSDVLMAGNGSHSGQTNILDAGDGKDVLIGGNEDDTLNGEDGDDVLIQSKGTDKIDGGAGRDIFKVSDDLDSQTVTAAAAAGDVATARHGTSGGDVTTIKNVEVFVGGAKRTKFVGTGNVAQIFVAGSGGADFTLGDGDVAIGNPNVAGGNTYHVYSTDLATIYILNFGKNDTLYVNDKKQDGAKYYSSPLGLTYDSNRDGIGGQGVAVSGSSSGWDLSLPTATFSKSSHRDYLPGHYWGTRTAADGSSIPTTYRAVTYVPSMPNGVAETEAGQFYYIDQTADANGGVTINGKLNITITGWHQGDGGISFSENNLARDTMFAPNIGGTPLAQADASYVPAYFPDVFSNNFVEFGNFGYYRLNGSNTGVAGSFGPGSAEWSNGLNTGWSAYDQIEQAINSILDNDSASPQQPVDKPEPSSDDPYATPPTADDEIRLTGTSGRETLDTAGYQNTVIGGGGGDTIIYGAGYGTIFIDEKDAAASPTNSLRITDGIDPANVTFSANSTGSIILSIAGQGDVVLQNALRSSASLTYGVQSVEFDDGTIWSYADLLLKLGTPSAMQQTIYGDSGTNRLDTVGVAHKAVGNGGQDTYAYDRGYGQLIVDARDAGGATANVLSLGGGIDPGDFSVSAHADGSLSLEFGGGDSITLLNALLSTNAATYGVQEIAFSDGSTWSYADLLAMADNPTYTQDIYGDHSANVLLAGGVARYINGGGGGDEIYFRNGDRAVTIAEADHAVAPANRLNLQDVDPADVSVRADAAGDLVLSFDGKDQVRIVGALTSTAGLSNGVQTVAFDDGTSWNYAGLLARADTASVTNRDLYGDAAGNTLDAGGFANSMTGAGGGDTFIYARGYGAVAIREIDTAASPANVLQFGAGISAGDLIVTGNEDGDVVISLGGGDVVTLIGALTSDDAGTWGVQSIAFADGTHWTYGDILSRLAADAGASGTIFGDGGANLLDSGGFVSRIVGGGGDDQFVFHTGYGALRIEESNKPGAASQLVFGIGIRATDVMVDANGDGDIRLVMAGGDVVTLAGALHSDGGRSIGVQQISFADGSHWTYADLLAKLSVATVGGPAAIYGDATANDLDPLGAATLVAGNGGGDTISYQRGYGIVTIDERDLTSRPDNSLVLGRGIDPAAVMVKADAAGDITIDAGCGDQIVLKNALNSDREVTFGIQQFAFDDGTIWTYDDLLDLADTASATNTTLYGDRSTNVLDGQGIATTLVGNGGGDTYTFHQGYGSLTIDARDRIGTENVLELGLGILPASVAVSANAAGDLLLSFGGGDVVLIKGALNGDSLTQTGVQTVQFANGTTWTYRDLIARSHIASATNPTLYGDGAADQFDSQGLAHAIVGRGGGDTISYDAGYGALAVDEVDHGDSPTNVIVLGATITPGDVTVSAVGNDFKLDFGGGDSITLVDAGLSAVGAVHGVQSVKFANGTIWDAGQIRAFATGTWQIADDGKASRIDEGANFMTSAPTIVLAFASNDVTISAGSDHNSLTLTSANGTTVTVADILRRGAKDGQSLHFSDGETFTLGELFKTAANFGESDGYLLGTAAAEDMDFTGGIQLAIGCGGGDRFRYDTGDGSVEIMEEDHGAAPDNVLTFGPGIGLSDFLVTTTSTGLFLQLPDGDEVMLLDALTGTDSVSFGVQRVVFDDGSSASYEDLLAIADTGSADNSGTLNGDRRANVIDAAGYSHQVNGNGGSDTFVYGAGYGDLQIHDLSQSAGSHAGIAFGPSIAKADVTIYGQASDSRNDLNGALFLSFGGSTIRIDNELSSATPIIDHLSFADGSTMSYAEILTKLQTPTTNGAIFGDGGANLLDSEGLARVAVGNGGGDTFVFDHGYGALTIYENDYAAAPSNRILFAAGITAADVTVRRIDYDTFQLSLSATDKITFSVDQRRQLNGGLWTGVQTVDFADGTSWDYSQLMDMALTAGSDNVNMFGDRGANVLDGGGTARMIVGEGGNDTFVYNTGYGQLLIDEQPEHYGDVATLQFGAGIGPDDLHVTHSGRDLIIDFGNGDVVTIKNQVNGGGGLQKIAFADGTIWNDIAAHMTAVINGTGGNDQLTGTPADEIFVGGRGDDKLTGQGGSDAYRYALGDGNDEIDDQGSIADSDTLQLTDLEPGDVQLTRDGSDLVVKILATGDFLRIDGQYSAGHPEFGIESINFAGGTSWNRATIASLSAGTPTIPPTLLEGGAGDDSLTGTAADETLVGHGGNDLLNGGSGSDIYRYASGDGNDTITDSGDVGNSDVIRLVAMVPDDVALRQVGNDLFVRDVTTGQEIQVVGQFDGSTPSGVEQILFDNATSWSRADILSLLTTSTNGADTVDGTTGDDHLRGLGGDDVLNSGDGDDRLFGDTGNDTLNGGNGDDILRGGAGNDAIAGGDGHDVAQFAGRREDYHIVNVGGVITVSDLVPGSEGDDGVDQLTGIEELRFGDGTVLPVVAGNLPPEALRFATLATIAPTFLNAAQRDPANGTYRLTPAKDDQVGGLWNAVDLSHDVRWSVRLYFGREDSGADGISFALQSAGASVSGANGVLTDRSLGIVFDTYQNGNEPASDFTQFVLDGQSSTSFDPYHTNANVEDGQWHNVAINWNFATHTLDYSLDGVAIASKSYDLVSLLGGTSVYFGFGGRTGGHHNYQGVDIVSVKTNVDQPSVVENAPAGTLVAILQGVDPEGSTALSYALADASGRAVTDDLFEIVNGNELRVRAGASIDYEASSQLGLFVKITDAGGLSLVQPVTVQVTNMVDSNEAPSALRFNQPRSAPSSLVGSVSQTATGYLLTPNQRDKSGTIWGNVDLSQDVVWTTKMNFGTSDSGAEGINFVLQNQSVTALGAGGLMNNSLAIHIDTHRNSGEPNSDFSQFRLNNTASTDFDAFHNLPNLEDGAWHDVVISWSAATQTLKYSINGVEVAQRRYDIIDDIFGGSPTGFYGFGAWTGDKSNEQSVQVISVATAAGHLKIDEDAPGNTVVAGLIGVDPNAADTLSYAVTNAAGATVTDPRFEIANGNQLRLKSGVSLAGMSGVTFDLFIKTTDSGGKSLVSPTHIDVGHYPPSPLMITGTSSNDTLKGGVTGEVMHGLEGNDTLLGGAGNDELDGQDGNDTLDGGAGDDLLQGDIGNDTYRFGIGGGHDTINDQRNGWDTGDDTIQFGAGITKSGIAATRDGEDLVLTITSTGDSIRIARGAVEVGGVSREIEHVRFADGSIWTSAEVRALGLGATSGNDTILGSNAGEAIDARGGNDFVEARAGDDLIIGGAGDDILSGEDGDDTYRYALGDGTDIINDNYEGFGGNHGVDTLAFAGGIDPANIRMSVENGYDFRVTFDGAAGSLLLVGSATQRTSAIERITFAGGTVWTYDDMVLRSLVATAGADNLYGGNQPDVINGLAGNDFVNGRDGNDDITGGTGDDLLVGQGGDDTYRYNLGDGDDVINDNYEGNNGNQGFDTLVLGAGITGANTNVTVSSNGRDFKLSFDGGSGSVTLVGAAVQSSEAVDQVVLADGTVWAYEDLQGLVAGGSTDPTIIAGTSGNDGLYGDNGAQILWGKGGDDYLEGRGGGDIYRYASGDGNDEIDEDGATSNIDVLKLIDLNAADVTLTRSGYQLLVTDNTTGQQVKVDYQFYSDQQYAIEQIAFSDGTVWDRERIRQEAWLRGDANGNTLYGSGQADTFVGGQGNDYLEGRGGGDVYRYAAGDGNDEIYEDGATTDIDVLKLIDLNPADVTLTRSGYQLLITNNATGQQVKVDYQFYSDQQYAIEKIAFADGAIWNRDRIAAETAAIQGTADDDVLNGATGADAIHGREGNDQIDASAGNDFIEGDVGDDTLIGGDGDDQLSGGDGNDVIYGDRIGLVATGANLVVNGSFETPGTIVGSAFWGHEMTDLPGWIKANSQNFQQVYSGFAGIFATNGTYWLDMECSGGDGSNMDFSQTVSGLAAGDPMLLSFDHANRMSASSGSFEVYWNGALVATISDTGTDTVTSNIHVTATGGDNVIRFRGIGVEDDGGASLDNIQLHHAIEGAIGAGHDILLGGAGDDDLIGGRGDDTIDGGAGNDGARLSGVQADYEISATAGSYTVRDLVMGRDGTDRLTNVEKIEFGDGSIVDLPPGNLAPSGLTLRSVLPIDFTFVGSAGQEGDGTYRLTPWSGGQLGAMWSPIDLSQDVRWTARLYFGSDDGGADGVSFALQGVGNTVTGTNGVLGTETLGIDFDTYTNSGEPNADFSAIELNGQYSAGFSAYHLHGNLENGAWHDVVIDWNAGTQTFAYSLDGVEIAAKNYDLATLIGGNQAYFGFGGRTGGASNYQAVDLISVVTRSDTVTVDQSIASGTTLATLQGFDANAGDALSYVLVDSTGSAISDPLFEITGGDQLHLKGSSSLDGLGGTTIDRFVKVTDTGGAATIAPIHVVVTGTQSNEMFSPIVVDGDDEFDQAALLGAMSAEPDWQSGVIPTHKWKKFGLDRFADRDGASMTPRVRRTSTARPLPYSGVPINAYDGPNPEASAATLAAVTRGKGLTYRNDRGDLIRELELPQTVFSVDTLLGGVVGGSNDIARQAALMVDHMGSFGAVAAAKPTTSPGHRLMIVNSG